MIEIYVIGPIILMLLSAAFFLIWALSRNNNAALMWGIAHAAYGVGIMLAFQHQHEPTLWLGLITVMAFSIYLTTFWLAIDAYEGRYVSVIVLLIYLGGISIAGLGANFLMGRASVVVLSIVVLTRSALHFYGPLRMRWVAAAFFLKAASYLSALADIDHFGTYLQPLWMYGVHWSTNLILALTLVQVAVHQSRNRLSQLLQHLPDALVATKLDGTVLFCNDAYARLCNNPTMKGLLGKRVMLLEEEFAEAAELAKLDGTDRNPSKFPLKMDRDISMPGSHWFPAEINFSTFRDFGELVILAQIHDLSEIKKAEQERHKLATTDRITGLPNRNHLESKLTIALRESQRYQQLCAVLLIDLDHFMRVNDTMGHAAGDNLIKEVAEALTAGKRDSDILGRFGGDEFLIIATNLPIYDAKTIAEQMARTVCQTLTRNFVVNGIDIRLGASVGVALMTKSGSTAANLIQFAELAMYDAKRLGRGGWSFFDETMEQQLRKNIQMESALRNAIEREELYLVYQPIVDSMTGATVKVEALLRWNSAEFGLVTPDVFIPVLEQSSQIIDVGNWVIETALRQCATWHQASRVVPVISINISTRQFLQHDFEEQFQRLLTQYRISPEFIELELTESLLADTDTDVAALLKRLSLAGISISIDDFGTGYSSLSYLARFEVDTVKIDQSFIADLESDPRHRSLVKMIIAMGHSLGLKVVAEGVETVAQQEFLQQQHCDYLQGYLFNEPVVPSEIQFENS